tara:strand:- start:5316 stop:6215 length:900 start_codon:yes stop_codon:yes gene_type:complete
MADKKKAEEVVEDSKKDPWDFDDPEQITEIPPTTVQPHDVPDTPEDDTEDSSEGVPDEVIERARNAGLSNEDLAAMGSPEQMEFVLNLLENKVEQRLEEVTAAVENGEAPDDEQASDDVSWIDNLDPDEAVDSDSARAVKAMKAKMDEMTRALESMTAQTQTVKHDSLFSALSKEWNDLFGGAKTSDQTVEQMSNRDAVVEEMETLRNGYRSRKRKMPDDSELFERALNSAFGDQVKDFARQDLNEKLQKRESQFISRASNTGSQGDLLNGRERAYQNVAQKMKDLGIDVYDDPQEVFE